MGDLHKRVVVIFGVTVLGGFPERPSDGDYAHPTCIGFGNSIRSCIEDHVVTEDVKSFLNTLIVCFDHGGHKRLLKNVVEDGFAHEFQFPFLTGRPGG